MKTNELSGGGVEVGQEDDELLRRMKTGSSELAKILRFGAIVDPVKKATYALIEIEESIKDGDFSGAVVWRIRGYDLPGLDNMDENWVVSLYDKARKNGDLFEAFGITQIMFLSWYKKFPDRSESEEGKKVQGLDWENELRGLGEAAKNGTYKGAEDVAGEYARMVNFNLIKGRQSK